MRVLALGDLVRVGARALLNGAVAGRPVRDVRVVCGPLSGARLRLDLRCEKAYWLGTYERELQGAFAGELRPGHVFWDVGAHVGFFSVLAQRLTGEGGRVVAFEANPLLHERLAWNLGANRGAPAEFVRAAVAGACGSASLAAGETAFEASLRPSAAGGSAEIVPALTLDAAAVTQPPPDVVKVDVEGAEADVVTGGRGLLSGKRPTFFVEVHGWGPVERLWETFEQCGYALRRLDGSVASAAAARQEAGPSGAVRIVARPE